MAKRRVYDVLQVFGNIPSILGMDMELRNGIWEGRYYLNGDRHAYKRDKLKVKIYDAGSGNDIWLHEQGGQSMSLASWLVNFGGCSDYSAAWRFIEGKDKTVDRVFTKKYRDDVAFSGLGKEVYVEPDEFTRYTAYDLWNCPLFRWMSRMFGRAATEQVWHRYGVTTDERGLVVWWYIDADGNICYDKRMRYCEDGHRDKSFGGTRKYRVGDGYTARPMFGAHLTSRSDASDGILSASDGISLPEWYNSLSNIKNALKTQKINIVESEKTALICSIFFGGTWFATGGKGNLRESDAGVTLWPDIDAVTSWERYGDVCEWWLDAEEVGAKVGETWDIGDFVVYLIKNNKYED